ENHTGIASINSMMQCMMKEVCGQCLQKQVNPQTGSESEPVFTCFNQDQHMDCVDFANLRQRLKTNSLAEKLSNRLLDCLPPPRKTGTNDVPPASRATSVPPGPSKTRTDPEPQQPSASLATP